MIKVNTTYLLIKKLKIKTTFYHSYDIILALYHANKKYQLMTT